jgi:hypothetical protein
MCVFYTLSAEKLSFHDSWYSGFLVDGMGWQFDKVYSTGICLRFIHLKETHDFFIKMEIGLME